jgi:hypothetical protein
MRCTEPGAARRVSLGADEGGGASAEGAIVASFLVMIFAACLFVARAVTRSAAAIETSRSAVWSRALDRCARGPEDTDVTRALGAYRRGAEAVSSAYAAHFGDVRTSRVTASTTASTTAGRAAGGRTVTHTETSETACNPRETPWSTDARAAALDYFCRQHPEPVWPEGCDPAVTTRGRP